MVSGASPAETNSGELERAQPALHQEELRGIADLIPQQIVVLDASGRAIFADACWLRTKSAFALQAGS